MQEYGPIAEGRGSFQRFVISHDASYVEHSEEEEYLQTYMMAWLETGEGVERTRKNYETYLRVALEIADATFRGKFDFTLRGGLQDRRCERHIKGLHEPSYEGSQFLDRMTYEIAVQRYERSEREKLALLALQATADPAVIPPTEF